MKGNDAWKKCHWPVPYNINPVNSYTHWYIYNFPLIFFQWDFSIYGHTHAYKRPLYVHCWTTFNSRFFKNLRMSIQTLLPPFLWHINSPNEEWILFPWSYSSIKLYLLKENQRRRWNKSARYPSVWLLQNTLPVHLPTNAGFAQKSPDVVREIKVSAAVQVGIQAETFQNTLPNTLGLNWGVFFGRVSWEQHFSQFHAGCWLCPTY